MGAQGRAKVLDGRAKGPSRSVPLLLKVEKFLRPREGGDFPQVITATPRPPRCPRDQPCPALRCRESAHSQMPRIRDTSLSLHM